MAAEQQQADSLVLVFIGSNLNIFLSIASALPGTYPLAPNHWGMHHCSPRRRLGVRRH